MDIDHVFDPAWFLEANLDRPTGLVILNQPITNALLLEKAWNSCKVRVCADGGANQLYEFLKDDKLRVHYKPEFIAGDLDSLRDDVREFYENLGVKVLSKPSQYATDFMKSVDLIDEQFGEPIDIVALGAMGGRVDQSFHSIQHLYLSAEKQQTVYLLSDQSITFLLPKGKSLIRTPLKHLGKTCGIIPVGGTAVITTDGLEWDVENWETRFGGQVSTSNHVLKHEITIHTNEQIIFTIELRSTTT